MQPRFPDNFFSSSFSGRWSVRFFAGRNAITPPPPPFDVTLFPARIATANRFTGQIEKKINDVGGNLLTKNHAGFAEFFPSWV